MCFSETQKKFIALGYKARDIRNAMRKAEHWKPNNQKSLAYNANTPVRQH